MERSNPDAYERRLRARFVRRAIETAAPLLALPLQHYVDAEGMTWAELAQSLGCSVDALNQVAICRPPRPDRFVADTEAIAADYVDPDLLLPLLRRLQVLEAFAGRTKPTSAISTVSNADDALLLAARDHEEELLSSPIPRADMPGEEQDALEDEDA